MDRVDKRDAGPTKFASYIATAGTSEFQLALDRIEDFAAIMDATENTDELKLEAAEILGWLGDVERALPTLLQLAAVDNPSQQRATHELVRLARRDALSKSERSVVADVFVQTLRDDQRATWNLAAHGLRALGDSTAIRVGTSALLSIAEGSDKSVPDRSNAIRLLSYFGSQVDVVAALSDVVQAGGGPVTMRIEAAETLAKLGEQSTAAGTLISIVESNDESLRHRYTAALALSKLGNLGTPTFLHLLEDPSSSDDLRKKVVHALEFVDTVDRRHRRSLDTKPTQQRDVAIAPALIAVIDDESNSRDLRLGAIKALCDGDSPEVVVPVLQRVVTEGVRPLRSAASSALSDIGEEHLAASLLTAAIERGEKHTTDKQSAIFAWQRVAETNPDEAVPKLRWILKDSKDSPRIRVQAALALRRLGAVDDVYETLAEVAQETDPNSHLARRFARTGLGKMGAVGVDLLVKIVVEDDNEFIRRDAADAIMCGEPVSDAESSPNNDSPVAALAKFVNDETVSHELRAKAALAIGRLGQIETATHYLEQLAEDAPDTAIHGLLRLNGFGALEFLVGLAQNPTVNPRGRVASLSAIKFAIQRSLGFTIHGPLPWARP